MPPHLTSRRSILILSSHLRLVRQSDLFPSGFPTKIPYTPLLSSIRATCPTHIITEGKATHEKLELNRTRNSCPLLNITGCSHFGFMDGVVVRYSDVSRERTASIFEVTELVHVYAEVVWKWFVTLVKKRFGGYRPTTRSYGGKRWYDCPQPMAVLSTIVIFHAVAMGSASTRVRSLLFDLHLSYIRP
jgi:hypothetical protein